MIQDAMKDDPNDSHESDDSSDEKPLPDLNENMNFREKMGEFMNYVGPGFLISIACLDPGNLGGDIAVGQQTRFRLFWILILAHVLCYIYQALSLRIAKRDIASLCRYSFSPAVSKILWMMAELALIASDTQEVLGAAVALNLLMGIPLIIGVIISIFLAFGILYLQKYGQRMLEGFFAGFVLLMAICFWINYIMLGPSLYENLKGLFPMMEKEDLPIAISLIGAIIMPQNLYLHSALVLTRKNQLLETKRSITFFQLETKIVMMFSLIINIAMIGTFSYFSDQPPLELQDAGQALSKSLGEIGAVIWGVGLFSSGQSATVAGALTGQYIMEGFLQMRISKQKRMLLTRIVSLVPCILVIQLSDIRKSMIFLNIIQFIQLPFVLIPTLKFSINKSLMGEYALQGRYYYIVMIMTGFVICLNALQLAEQFPEGLKGILLCSFFFLAYFYFLYFIATYKTKSLNLKTRSLEIEMLSFGC